MDVNKTNKGFTLIELLIVVAIIGILAAVGTAVIPGLLGKSKMNVTKVNHSNVVKKITLTIMDCNLNGYVEMMPNSTNRVKSKQKCGATNADYANGKQTFFVSWLINDMINNGAGKNPYRSSSHPGGGIALEGGRCSTALIDNAVGVVNILSNNSMDVVSVCTCLAKPCSQADNRLEKMIPIKM
jgi:prepilin-type N-terminal cleavage/methylation domain-containing protein